MSHGQKMPKSVMFNGVKVGEIAATGDDKQDAERAYQFLVDRGLVKPISLAARTFRQAAAFSGVAAGLFPELRDDNPRFANIAAPFVVNISFAIELYLKALGATSGVALRGHRLDRLFAGLPPVVQQSLESKMPLTLAKYGQPLTITMSQALADARDAFVEWRYSHEREGTVDGRIFQIRVCIAVAEVLHHACVDTGKV